MSGLPWFRMDSHIYANDKILALVSERGGGDAFVAYCFALGGSVGHGTNGTIPAHMLPTVRAPQRRVEQLVDRGLWEYASDKSGLLIRNFNTRQQTAHVTELKSSLQSQGARKGNCKRWHSQPCNCWEADQ